MVLQQIPYVNNASKPVCPAIPKDTNLTVGVIEAEYADCSFGPRTWDKLGRYTTINGVKLPVIRMQPGSVERWRLIDSAIREVIQPELVRVDHSGQSAPSRLNFHEIAVDGLASGVSPHVPSWSSGPATARTCSFRHRRWRGCSMCCGMAGCPEAAWSFPRSGATLPW